MKIFFFITESSFSPLSLSISHGRLRQTHPPPPTTHKSTVRHDIPFFYSFLFLENRALSFFFLGLFFFYLVVLPLKNSKYRCRLLPYQPHFKITTFSFLSYPAFKTQLICLIDGHLSVREAVLLGSFLGSLPSSWLRFCSSSPEEPHPGFFFGNCICSSQERLTAACSRSFPRR